MSICKLCNRKTADKTNSHVIPHFLIQSMINVDGIKGRNRELSVGIGKESITEYFGSAVLPDKIEQYVGHELSVEEIEKQKHHFTVDYAFCSDCEKRFASIESYYSETKSKETNELVINEIDSKLSFLFWASIVWRLSVTNLMDFKLKEKENKKLRNLLDNCLNLKISEVIKKAEYFNSCISNYAYKLMVYPNSENTANRYCYGHPKFQMPYSLIINNYVLLFYVSKSHVNQIKQTFFGFEQLYENAPINIQATENESILKIPEILLESSIAKFVELQCEDFLKSIINQLNNLHLQLFGLNCSSQIIDATITRIIEENPDILGGRYNNKRMIQIFAEEIEKLVRQ